MNDRMPAADVRALLAAARARLTGVPREVLGQWATPGRLFRRAPRITPVGSAWRLGVLLLPAGTDDVLAVGEALRAEPEVRRGYTAVSARERAATRGAAVRGGIAAGETVHVGWHRIDLDAVGRGEASGPLQLVDGIAMIQWTAGGGLMPLAAYLDERVVLLTDPSTRA